MPIRNFYIDCEIDGQKSKLTGGPRTKDGGFSLTIYQRSNGKKTRALDVVGYVKDDGELKVDIISHLFHSIKEVIKTND